MEASYDPPSVSARSTQFIVLSGCSGGGKSSLLAELGRRGFAVYEEPGRQVVKEQLFIGGDALPWGDVDLFLELTISRSIHHLIEAARGDRVAFFDRGIIDQVNGYRMTGREIPPHLQRAAARFRYHDTVFLVPPWSEIFVKDEERWHGFEESVAAYEALVETYRHFGYRPIEVPKTDIAARAEFVLGQIGMSR